jgi:phosphoethanolamine N-methyltransferase
VFLTEDLSVLSDEEMLGVMETSLLHTHETLGYLFFTAGCSSQRTPINYVDLAQMRVVKDNKQDDQAQYGFELVFAKPNASTPFTRAFFLFNKVKLDNYHGFKTLQEFMDHKQYTRNGVIRYERIFGDGFISTGGVHTTTKFLQELNLKPGMRVLDVGCGIGGGDFLMAQVNNPVYFFQHVQN